MNMQKNCTDCAIHLSQDSNNYQVNTTSILNEKHLQNNCISSKTFCRKHGFLPQCCIFGTTGSSGHFKGLISGNLEPTGQGRDSTFTFCHTLVKKAILLLKEAKGV